MKKIIFSAALLTAGVMFTSCSEDLLDIPQKAVSNIDSFYKTDGDAEEAVTAMYARFTEEIGGNEGIWSAYLTGINYHSDDVFAAGGNTGDHADFRIMNEMRYDASSQPVDRLYGHIYKAVFSSNLVITYVGANADTPVKKQAVAEAREARKKLAEKRAKKALAEYWAGSVSASVLADYKNGNVKVIHC